MQTFLNIQVELRILDYLIWTLTLRYFISFLIYFFFKVIILIYFNLFLTKIYQNIKFHRNKLCFLTILTYFFFIPPDFFLQFIVIINSFIFYELIFFIFCYKICNV